MQGVSFWSACLQEWRLQAAGGGTSSTQLPPVRDWRLPVAAPGSSKSHEAELLKEMCGQTWIDKEDLSDWQSLGEGAFATVQKAKLTLDSGTQVSLVADMRGYDEGQGLLCSHCWEVLCPPTWGPSTLQTQRLSQHPFSCDGKAAPLQAASARVVPCSRRSNSMHQL